MLFRSGHGVGRVTAAGLVFAFATMITFAIMLILGPRQPQGVGSFARAGAPLAVAAVAWFIVRPAWDVPWDLLGHSVEAAGVAVPLWFAIAWTIVVGAVLSFAIVLAGAARVGAGAASMFGMAEPVVGALLAWALLGQDLSPVQGLGILITVGVVGVVEHARARRIGAVELPDALAPLSTDRR